MKKIHVPGVGDGALGRRLERQPVRAQDVVVGLGLHGAALEPAGDLAPERLGRVAGGRALQRAQGTLEIAGAGLEAGQVRRHRGALRVADDRLLVGGLGLLRAARGGQQRAQGVVGRRARRGVRDLAEEGDGILGEAGAREGHRALDRSLHLGARGRVGHLVEDHLRADHRDVAAEVRALEIECGGVAAATAAQERRHDADQRQHGRHHHAHDPPVLPRSALGHVLAPPTDAPVAFRRFGRATIGRAARRGCEALHRRQPAPRLDAVYSRSPSSRSSRSSRSSFWSGRARGAPLGVRTPRLC